VLRSATAAAAGLGVSLLDSWIQFWHTACPELAAAQQKQQQQQQQQGTRELAPAGNTAAADMNVANAAAASQVMMCYGMLSDNYRSHVRLLDLPSRLFYGGALRACAPPAAVAPPPWSELMVHEAAAAAGPEAAGAEGAGGTPAVPQQAPPAAAAAAAEISDSAEHGLGDVLGPSSTLFVGVNGEQRQVRSTHTSNFDWHHNVLAAVYCCAVFAQLLELDEVPLGQQQA
jgi:hypothetical protein